MIPKVIQNHWGKILVGSLAGYGVNYGFNSFRSWQVRALLQREADTYGQQPIAFYSKPAKVIVLVDVRSANLKARILYKRDVEPLLLLAGYDVEMIESRERGMTKDLAQSLKLEDSDAVVVLGDDGTGQEFVTGWMRREDASSVCETKPVCFVPAGQHNSFVNSLLYPGGCSDRFDEIHERCEATMRLVRGKTTMVDTVSVTSKQGRQVHCLSGLVWGSPAGLIGDTFNAYSKVSKFMAKARQVKNTLLNGNTTPTYNATIKYHVPQATGLAGGESEEVTETISFGQCFVTSTPTVYGMRLAKDAERTVQDGLLDVAWTGSVSTIGLFSIWRAMSRGLKVDGMTMLEGYLNAGGKEEEVRVIRGIKEIKIEPLDTHDITVEVPVVKEASAEVEREDSTTANQSDDKENVTQKVTKTVFSTPLSVDGEVFDTFAVTVRVNNNNLRVCT
eukprot:CFRG1337T1